MMERAAQRNQERRKAKEKAKEKEKEKKDKEKRRKRKLEKQRVREQQQQSVARRLSRLPSNAQSPRQSGAAPAASGNQVGQQASNLGTLPRRREREDPGARRNQRPATSGDGSVIRPVTNPSRAPPR
jgi:hypothetical protein